MKGSAFARQRVLEERERSVDEMKLKLRILPSADFAFEIDRLADAFYTLRKILQITAQALGVAKQPVIRLVLFAKADAAERGSICEALSGSASSA